MHLLGYCLVFATLLGVGLSPWSAITINVTDLSGNSSTHFPKEAKRLGQVE